MIVFIKKSVKIKLIGKTVVFADIFNKCVGVSNVHFGATKHHLLNILSEGGTNLLFKLLLKGRRGNTELVGNFCRRKGYSAVCYDVVNGIFDKRRVLGKL